LASRLCHSGFEFGGEVLLCSKRVLKGKELLGDLAKLFKTVVETFSKSFTLRDKLLVAGG
jgi:hypothetical protein